MTCTNCHGNRLVFVLPGYVDQQAPVPEQSLGEALADFEARVYENRLRRAALANTTYPCRDCSTAAFLRWAGGHLDPGHETGDCSECRARTAPQHGGHGQRRRRGGDQPPMPSDVPGYVLTDDPPPDWTQTRKDLE